MSRALVQTSILALLLAGPVAPGDAVYTSTRCVSGLATASDGSVWASTRGGVLRRDASGTWRKFACADGLPSTEVLGIAAEGESVRATFPTASARWDGRSWQVEPASTARSRSETARCVWRGGEYIATPTGLTVREGSGTCSVPLPESRGSHISALLPRGERLWAAMYGDGLWTFDGKSWERPKIGLPEQAREITALAEQGKTLWLGTRQEGVWEFDGPESFRGHQHVQADEPYDHDCQALAVCHGVLYASTLQDGLCVTATVRAKDSGHTFRSLSQGEPSESFAPTGPADRWTRHTQPELSSSCPREMVEFEGALYLRHANGKVDRFDGTTWTRNVFTDLPRKGVTVIAGDAERLCVALWGGWSEFDGPESFGATHHLKHSELQGVPVTAMLTDGDRLWIGTQGRGVIEFDRTSGALSIHDERRGLPDDWIRCLAKVGSTVYAGTYCGGLAQWDGSSWKTESEIGSVEISALCPDGSGGLFIGTRHGVWRQAANGSLTQLRPGIEVQALRSVDGGLWIGCRTEIRFVAGPL